MRECTHFIVMVWSHGKRLNDDRFLEEEMRPQKLTKILRRGAELPSTTSLSQTIFMSRELKQLKFVRWIESPSAYR